MPIQATLPLQLDDLAPYGRPRSDQPALRQRGQVEYHEIGTREILNRSASSKMPFEWTINPYRGCEFGCTYCYARYTHEFFDFSHWREFERKIFVKRGAARSLERRLKRTPMAGRPIAIGTVTDPYQPAERHYGVTRELLETLTRFEGLSLSITTKSPLILRDLELLAALDRKHAVTVNVSLTTLDPVLARRIERQAPAPRARLDAAARLAARGLAVSIFCMPLMPGVNAGSRRLLPIFEAARTLGAFDLTASPLFLKPAARRRFWPWLRREFPDLVPRYRQLYRGRSHLSKVDADNLLSIFRRLRLEMGFPRPSAR